MESFFGKDHPNIARDLNNLAGLLQDTNRLAEAEPLMRRMAGIFVDFTVKTGHQHQHLMTAINNYGELLIKMGRTKDQAREKIMEIIKPIVHLIKI